MATTSKASHARHIKTLLTYLKNNPSNKQVKQQCLEYIQKLSSKDTRIKAYLSLARIYLKSYPAEALRYLHKVVQLDKKNSAALKMMQAAHHYKHNKHTASNSDHRHPHQQKTVARARPSRHNHRDSRTKTPAVQSAVQGQGADYHDSQTMYSAPMINLDAHRVKSLKQMTLSSDESVASAPVTSVVDPHPSRSDEQGSFLATDEDIDFEQLHESVTGPDQPSASPLEILPFDEPSVAASPTQATSVDSAEDHSSVDRESAGAEEKQELETETAPEALTGQDEHTGPEPVAGDVPPAVAKAPAVPDEMAGDARVADDGTKLSAPTVSSGEIREGDADPDEARHADLLLNYLAHLIDSGQAYLGLIILASLTDMADTEFDQGVRRAMVECYLQANSCLNRLVPALTATELTRLSQDDAVNEWKNMLLTVAHTQSEYAIAI